MPKKDTSDSGANDGSAQPTTPEEEQASVVEMKMSPTEFAELRAQADRITQQDYHLGQFLTALLHHVGHAHGLDMAQEDAKAAEEEAAKAREAAQSEQVAQEGA